jgi:hypothetical protein
MTLETSGKGSSIDPKAVAALENGVSKLGISLNSQIIKLEKDMSDMR